MNFETCHSRSVVAYKDRRLVFVWAPYEGDKTHLTVLPVTNDTTYKQFNIYLIIKYWRLKNTKTLAPSNQGHTEMIDIHSRDTDQLEILNYHFSDQDIWNSTNLSLEITPLKQKNILHQHTKDKYLIDLDMMYKVLGLTLKPCLHFKPLYGEILLKVHSYLI